jgi:FG-GAP-like repeat
VRSVTCIARKMRLLIVLFSLFPTVANADVMSARFIEPTTRYAHGVLGDAIEWGGLEITSRACATCELHTITVTLPEHRVFEDIETRIVDVDGDGSKEVVVVESDVNEGASLAIYNGKGKVAATDFIGNSNRWLAPSAVADLDGDGKPEIAYVDRPHIRGDLVIARFSNGTITELDRLKGLTNHRIGDDYISGGLNTCSGKPELQLADLSWDRVMRVYWKDGKFAVDDMGSMPKVGLKQNLTCAAQ